MTDLFQDETVRKFPGWDRSRGRNLNGTQNSTDKETNHDGKHHFELRDY